MIVGVPDELSADEKRVALVPDVAETLVAQDNTSMLFGDAKQSMQNLLHEYKENTS